MGAQLGAPVPAQTLHQVGECTHGVGVPAVSSSYCFFPGVGPPGKYPPCAEHSMQLVHSQPWKPQLYESLTKPHSTPSLN